MRTAFTFATMVLMAACHRTPEQQEADKLRSDAQERGAAIESQAASEADRLQQEAKTLKASSKRAGGFTGQRLQVRADALSKEAKIIRKQSGMKAEAMKETANAKIKTSESR
jgi:hypothetical protein